MCQDTRARIQCIGSKPLSSTYLFFSVHFALWCWIYPALSIGNGVWLGANQLRNGFLLFASFFSLLRVFMFAIHVCWFDNSDRFNGLLSPALRFLFYYFPISLTSSRLHVVLMDYIHTFSCTWPCSPGLCIPCIMQNSVHVVSRSLFLLFTVFCLLDGFPFFCCFEKKTPLVLQNASQPAWYMLQNYSRWNESKAFRLFKYA